MTKTALVLGGGGMLGVSWSTGVIAGLCDAGVDVTGADRIVGTSAGSIVGTQIAQGRPLNEMIEWHHAPRDPDAIELTLEPAGDCRGRSPESGRRQRRAGVPGRSCSGGHGHQPHGLLTSRSLR